MNRQQRSDSGLTLIEVIVIVAVILVLWGLMLPIGGSDIESAYATRIGNQGKNIVASIITENMFREGTLTRNGVAATNAAAIWPAVGQIDPQRSNSVFTATSSANAYFAWLIEDQVVESLTGFGPFAGGGVGSAASADDLRTKEHNVWNIVANLDRQPTGAPPFLGEPPFLFTRNFHLTAPMLLSAEARDDWADRRHWHAKMKPFGRERAVVVTRGASVSIIRPKTMTRSRFLDGAAFGATTNASVAIWYAVGAEKPPSP